MKCTGKMYYQGYIDADGTVTDAVITRNRISIDWSEDGDEGHLRSVSDDGIHFSGWAHYTGYPEEEDHQFQLTLYRGRSGVLLFGTWRKRDMTKEGRWTFELDRVSPPGE